MIEPTRSSLVIVTIGVFTITALVSCGWRSDTTGGPSNNNARAGDEQTTEVKLRKSLGSELTIVVKAEKEMYWAIPSSGIAEVSPTTPAGIVKVAIKPGTRMAGGSGHGDPTQIAEMLLEQMGPSGGPYFFSTKNKGQPDEVSISGQVGEAKANLTIGVKEVLLSKALQ
jgi:hypothetical protein